MKKKILVLMILGLVAFNSAFGCESIFDEVEELTCEAKYLICRDNKMDITVCDSIKEKVQKFEEEYTKADEVVKELNKSLKEIDKKLKDDDLLLNSKVEWYKLIAERQDIEEKVRPLRKYRNSLWNDFLGEEGKIVYSKNVLQKLEQIFEKNK